MELDCSRRVKWSSTKQFDEEQYTPRRPAVIKRARPRPVVARFVLDSPVLPLVEDTLKIAELARRSFMGKYRRIEEQRLYGGPTPEGVMLPRSEVFSGKDADGRYLQGHQHAFYLPTDEDAGFTEAVGRWKNLSEPVIRRYNLDAWGLLVAQDGTDGGKKRKKAVCPCLLTFLRYLPPFLPQHLMKPRPGSAPTLPRNRHHAIFRSMSQHPPSEILADALCLPPQDRLAIAAELINSVEGQADDQWDAAWLVELEKRMRDAAEDPSKLEDWASVRERILKELRHR
jgi:putative addiction module component (TIGR02574 family)